MSQFTEYQVRRFRFIFNQYSEDAVTEADVETDPFQDRFSTDNSQDSGLNNNNNHNGNPFSDDAAINVTVGDSSGNLSDEGGSRNPRGPNFDRRIDIEGDGPVTWKLKLNYRLTASEMFQLLPRLGPPVSLKQVQQFFYDYDSSCTGALDFEDFLEFLADYQVTLEAQRDEALAHYNSQL
ncbi:hypothetical protein HDU76_009589, partial [Blyttiomyces sp. JEL0837]